jgi:hypothetical protein
MLSSHSTRATSRKRLLSRSSRVGAMARQHAMARQLSSHSHGLLCRRARCPPVLGSTTGDRTGEERRTLGHACSAAYSAVLRYARLRLLGCVGSAAAGRNKLQRYYLPPYGPGHHVMLGHEHTRSGAYARPWQGPSRRILFTSGSSALDRIKGGLRRAEPARPWRSGQQGGQESPICRRGRWVRHNAVAFAGTGARPQGSRTRIRRGLPAETYTCMEREREHICASMARTRIQHGD